MSDTNNGGPAFPTGIQPNDYMDAGMPFERGMTLRDWFAGQALTGMLAREDYYQHAVSKQAYEIADEMLNAREAGNAT